MDPDTALTALNALTANTRDRIDRGTASLSWSAYAAHGAALHADAVALREAHADLRSWLVAGGFHPSAITWRVDMIEAARVAALADRHALAIRARVARARGVSAF